MCVSPPVLPPWLLLLQTHVANTAVATDEAGGLQLSEPFPMGLLSASCIADAP